MSCRRGHFSLERFTKVTLFGTARALEVIHNHWQQSARDIVGQLYLAIRNFRGPSNQGDDMTAVVVKAQALDNE